jgi:hypothetical protein
MRVDFGVDEILDSPSNTHPLLHVNVGVGMGTQQWSATAEYQRVFEIEDSEALQNIGVSVRYHGAVSPYLSVSTPLEDELRGDAIAVALGITLTP